MRPSCRENAVMRGRATTRWRRRPGNAGLLPHAPCQPGASPPPGGLAPPGETHMIGSACTPRRHENAVLWTVPVSAPRHHAERRAGKGTPTSGRHSPPQAGGREGPRVGGWFASRPGSRRSASSGRLRGTRLSLRFAQRCRPPPGDWPEVGVPLRPAPSGRLGLGGAAFSQQLGLAPTGRLPALGVHPGSTTGC